VVYYYYYCGFFYYYCGVWLEIVLVTDIGGCAARSRFFWCSFHRNWLGIDGDMALFIYRIVVFFIIIVFGWKSVYIVFFNMHMVFPMCFFDFDAPMAAV
jgi:hypothetical protein